MPEWLPHASFALLALVAVVALVLAWRRGNELENRDTRIEKLKDQLVKAALRESALNIELQVTRAEVEFWREGARFAQIQDTKTRVIPR